MGGNSRQRTLRNRCLSDIPKRSRYFRATRQRSQSIATKVLWDVGVRSVTRLTARLKELRAPASEPVARSLSRGSGLGSWRVGPPWSPGGIRCPGWESFLMFALLFTSPQHSQPAGHWL